MAKVKTNPEVSAKIMGQVLHELNPARSVEEWTEHVNKTGNDPKAFFNGNGEGLEEYNAFISNYDKDKRDRQLKKRRAPGVR